MRFSRTRLSDVLHREACTFAHIGGQPPTRDKFPPPSLPLEPDLPLLLNRWRHEATDGIEHHQKLLIMLIVLLLQLFELEQDKKQDKGSAPDMGQIPSSLTLP